MRAPDDASVSSTTATEKEERIMAVRITDECTACGTCLETCPTGSIEEGEKYKVNDTCTDCLACVDSCPTGAIVQN
jgi:ferredoxin